MGKKRKGQPIDWKSLNSGSFAVLEGDDGTDEKGLSEAESVDSLHAAPGAAAPIDRPVTSIVDHADGEGEASQFMDMHVLASALAVGFLHTAICTFAALTS